MAYIGYFEIVVYCGFVCLNNCRRPAPLIFELISLKTAYS